MKNKRNRSKMMIYETPSIEELSLQAIVQGGVSQIQELTEDPDDTTELNPGGTDF